MDARLEEIFRQETRRTLGAERMTVDQLARAIADFEATAPPEELAVFALFIRAIVSGMDAAGTPHPPTVAASHDPALSTVSGAMAALDALRGRDVAPESRPAQAATDVPAPARPPSVAPRRPAPAPFRVSYPAPAPRPRAVTPPEPPAAPEPDPDDIEDFTDSATAS